MLLKILISVAIGALAGYITNDFALKLMFSGVHFQIKGKTIFKIDPFIAKAKKNLGDNLGSVVQDKLMNAPDESDESVLFQKIKDEKFGAEVRSCVADLLNHILPEMLNGMKFSELDGWQDTSDGLESLLRTFIQDNLGNILAGLSERVVLTDIFTETQQNVMAGRLFDMVLQEFESSGIAKNCMELLDGMKTSCLADILGEDETDAVCRRLCRAFAEEAVNEAFAEPQKLKDLLKNADFEAAIYEAFRSAADKSLSQLLGNASIEKFVQQNKPALKAFVCSEQFNTILYKLSEQIILSLEQMKVPLYNFFPMNEQNMLSDFINRKLPAAVPYLSDYLRSRKEEINGIIEDEVNAVIENETSAFFWSNGIRKIFREQIIDAIHQVDIIRTLEDYTDGLLQSEDMEATCRSMLTDFLKNTTLSDIVSKFLSPQSMGNILYQICNEFFDDIPEQFYRQLGNIRPSTFLSDEAIRKISAKTDELLVAGIPDRVLGGEETKQKLIQEADRILREKVKRLMHTEIGMFGITVPSDLGRILGRFAREKVKPQSKLQSLASRFLKGKKLSYFLKGKIDAAAEKLSNEVVHRVMKILGRMRISSLLRRIAGTKAFVMLTKALQQHVVPLVLRNGVNVKTFVSNKIQGMDTDEVGQTMQKFIGRELKPLCIMGAVLGGVIGLGIELVQPFSGALWVRAILFAAIGVVTNWLAFFGVFRPYVQKKWLPGFSYIPKRIPIVAEAFGTAVDRFLLDSETVHAQFHAKKNKLKFTAADYLTSDGFRILDQYMSENSKAISGKLSSFLMEKLAENDDKIADALCKMMGKIRLGDILSRDNCNALGEQVMCLLRDNEGKISYYAVKTAMDSEVAVRNLPFSNGIRESLRTGVKTTGRELISNSFNTDTLRLIAEKYDPAWQELCGKTVRDCLSDVKDKQLNQIAEHISGWASGQIFSAKTRDFICAQTDKLMQKEFDPDTEISGLMDGKICTFLNSNANKITQFLLKKLMREIDAAKDRIIDHAVRQIHNNVNWILRASVDADDLVEKTIQRIIDYDIYPFFQRESEFISDRLRYFLKQEVYTIKISALQLDMRKLDIKPLVRSVLADSSKNKKVSEIIRVLADWVLDFLMDQKLHTFAAAANIRFLPDVCDRFNSEISLFVEKLALPDNALFMEGAADYIICLADSCVFSHTVGEVLRLCGESRIQPMTDHALEYVLNRPEIQRFIQEFMSQMYDDCADRSALSCMDEQEWRATILGFLHDTGLMTEPISDGCGLVLRTLIDDHFCFIAPETRKQIVNTGVDACLETVDRHLEELLNSINIKAITEKVVGSMDGRGIHKMFDSFAKRYFNELIWLGCMGVVFFIPGWKAAVVYIVLSAIYLIPKKK